MYHFTTDDLNYLAQVYGATEFAVNGKMINVSSLIARIQSRSDESRIAALEAELERLRAERNELDRLASMMLLRLFVIDDGPTISAMEKANLAGLLPDGWLERVKSDAALAAKEAPDENSF